VLKAFKKLFSCNGTIVKDEIKGMVIQLQGDKRNEVSDFLIQEGIGTKSTVKIHG
jgi:translation initiation factor 1